MIKNMLLLLSFLSLGATPMLAQHKPVPIIFDTDMGPDYDDVGAIALLHAFADKGQATILATIASTKYENVAPVLSVLNTYFKRAHLPIGIPKSHAVDLRDWQHWSDTLVAKYPHVLKTNAEAADAVALYRKILSEQPDGSVTIVTVGFLTNLAHLLQSEPDEYSRLPGKDLVKQKVKQLVCMAGGFPSGKEFNIDRDFPSARYVFEHWKTPVLFSGFEIGKNIKTGIPLIHNETIQNSPVKDVFNICIPLSQEDKDGRMSWDQTAVLVAVLGHQPFFTTQRGTIVIDEKDGSNTWINNNKGSHEYLIEKMPFAEVEKMINDLMMHQPQL